ncbi:hypothetical protein HPT27_09900 [Permianibacter sp. IMCC34836]|uniref:hypothetical protein n=1 Tax=Permianibacter fluminis TaxID=2738515 RepID=UPI0015536FFF|nr:hypothetical protein [Permianibacter fluminis]NQD37341.1 hypothetical protein [Permianibacter fluminis]
MSLFVPALLAPVRAGESQHPIQAVDSQPLRELFRQCRQQTPADFARTLAHWLGADLQHDAAALARALQLPVASSWLFAAPVVLRPDHAGIYLLGSRALQLNAAAAAAYCTELNTWLQQDGMQLYPVTPSRWLLALPEPTQLQWVALEDAIGVDLRQVWPQGAGALRWQSRLTEWQMLLNQSAQNRAQLQQGRSPAHGIWLWGRESTADHTAFLPSISALTESWFLAANDASSPAGSARAEPSLTALLAASPVQAAVVDQRLHDAFIHGDVVGYQQAYQQFLGETLQPIQRALADGRIRELALYPEDGRCYLLKPPSRWQFWQRTPLPALLRSA